MYDKNINSCILLTIFCFTLWLNKNYTSKSCFTPTYFQRVGDISTVLVKSFTHLNGIFFLVSLEELGKLWKWWTVYRGVSHSTLFKISPPPRRGVTGRSLHKMCETFDQHRSVIVTRNNQVKVGYCDNVTSVTHPK